MSTHPTCIDCGTPMVSGKGGPKPPAGFRKHYGKGLCSKCWQAVKRASQRKDAKTVPAKPRGRYVDPGGIPRGCTMLQTGDCRCKTCRAALFDSDSPLNAGATVKVAGGLRRWVA